MAKVEHLIQRENGSEVKVVAQECFGEGLTRSVDVYVLRRDTPESPWALCSDRPHPDWRSMSVDEYTKRGRSEMLQTVSHGEILKAVIELNKLSDGMGFIVEDTPEMKRRGMRP